MSLKDGGERHTYASGMVREPSTGKPRYDLCAPLDLPMEYQMFYRLAMQMGKGADGGKYGDRNWEKANSEEELARYKESAFRHFMQWYFDEEDEDHASAFWFNTMAAEYVKYRLSQQK